MDAVLPGQGVKCIQGSHLSTSRVAGSRGSEDHTCCVARPGRQTHSMQLFYLLYLRIHTCVYNRHPLDISQHSMQPPDQG